MSFWVYILANRRGGTLYVGVTNYLVRRAFEHREGLVPGFTKRYGVKMLVYYERHDTAAAAIQREKNIKHWPREWKIDLILSINPDWRDLYDEIAQISSRPVIAGLDPRSSLPGLTRQIHPLRKKFLRSWMDPRVKPAGDGEKTAVHPLPSLPGLTRQSIRFAKSSYEDDGPAGQARG